MEIGLKNVYYKILVIEDQEEHGLEPEQVIGESVMDEASALGEGIRLVEMAVKNDTQTPMLV